MVESNFELHFGFRDFHSVLAKLLNNGEVDIDNCAFTMQVTQFIVMTYIVISDS